MKEIVYSGEGDCDNWMDFKDLLIKQLQECDNEYQFHKIIIAIWMSVGINPEHTQELRKKIFYLRVLNSSYNAVMHVTLVIMIS